MNVTDPALRIGDWRVDPALDEISKDGHAVKLERRAMQLLLCLAMHAGQVVSVERLLDHGCLVRVRSQPANEKTDALLVLNIEAARTIGREQPDQILRGVPFTLDFDRLMGVRFRENLGPGPTDRSWARERPNAGGLLSGPNPQSP